MNSIGGFFELEKGLHNNNPYHLTAYALNSGRACLALIIDLIKPNLIYLPFYTCDALLGPILEKNIEYSFYEIDKQFKIKKLPLVKPDELIIYINYFGMRSDYVQELRNYYEEQLIVDNTQAFFDKRDTNNWSFNSARKFFGVPDGAYLYGAYNKESLQRNVSVCMNHLLYRSVGRQGEAYEEFAKYELSIDNSIYSISEISEQILGNIDYSLCARKRSENFKLYHEYLSKYNKADIFEIGQVYGPYFCYPLILDKPINRELLFNKNIFIPWLWRDVLNRKISGYNWEKSLIDSLLPLPVDQRYGAKEIEFVVQNITNLISQ